MDCVDVSGMAGKGEQKMNLLRSFINANIKLSKWFDRQFLPSYFVKDGNKDFIFEMAPSYLRQGIKYMMSGEGSSLLWISTKKAIYA